jgi:uncharacterized protein YodC (DUF2158 family)
MKPAVGERLFRLGDVVRLWSGGPRMTIECFGNSTLVSCIWYDKLDRKYKREVIHGETLVIVVR